MRTDVFLSTPLREGRHGHNGSDWRWRRFYPRPCVRGDARTRCRGPPRHCFYPRPCVRGDAPRSTDSRPHARCFYPRPCVRGDLPMGGGLMAENMFLSTPLREGRPWPETDVIRWQQFLSTPLREGRLLEACRLAWRGMFLSTPLREGRHSHYASVRV